MRADWDAWEEYEDDCADDGSQYGVVRSEASFDRALRPSVTATIVKNVEPRVVIDRSGVSPRCHLVFPPVVGVNQRGRRLGLSRT